MTCPCGKGESVDTCCGRYIKAGEKAPTAEALMRARYTAYAIGEVEFIKSSHEPKTRDQFDTKSASEWSRESQWHGLEIVATEQGTEADTDGTVEFIASYSVRGQMQKHHEKAIFRKEGGEWFYVDGNMVKGVPFRRTEPKVGRNDPCHCGSGKKFKKCHGQAARA